MILLRNCLVLLAVVPGCGSSDSYCEDFVQVVAAPSDGADPVRVGYAFTSYADSIAALSDGSVVVPTCTDLATFDAAGAPVARIATGQSLYVSTGADDTIYATTRARHLLAATADGTIRLDVDLPGVEGVVPAADAIYGEQGIYPFEMPASRALLAVEPTTGAVHTVLPAQRYDTAQHLIGAGPGGGAITVVETTTATTLRHLDADGTARWELVATADQPHIERAAPTPDGKLVVIGSARSTITIGDFSIPSAGDSLSFVFAVDANGVPAWGYALDAQPRSVAVFASGDILIGAAAPVDSSDPHSFDFALAVLVVRPTGVVKTIPLTGVGDLYNFSVVPSSPGRAWLQLALFEDEDSPSARLQLGPHVFTETGYYLFQLQL